MAAFKELISKARALVRPVVLEPRSRQEHPPPPAD